MNRFFYRIGLDIREVYKYGEDFEELNTDYTLYQLRSFAFAKADEIAYTRLHRLDEMKAMIDLQYSKNGHKELESLREEILDSHLIEDEDVDPEVSKKEMQKHNMSVFRQMQTLKRK